MAGNFKIGDLVWAKMKGFPAWPGKVIQAKDGVKRPAAKKSAQFIFFFGSENYAWIPEENMVKYRDGKSKYMLTQRIPRGFKEAVEAIEDAMKSVPEDMKGSDLPSIEEELAQIFPNRPAKADAARDKGARGPQKAEQKTVKRTPGSAPRGRPRKDSLDAKRARIPDQKEKLTNSKPYTKLQTPPRRNSLPAEKDSVPAKVGRPRGRARTTSLVDYELPKAKSKLQRTSSLDMESPHAPSPTPSSESSGAEARAARMRRREAQAQEATKPIDDVLESADVEVYFDEGEESEDPEISFHSPTRHDSPSKTMQSSPLKSTSQTTPEHATPTQSPHASPIKSPVRNREPILQMMARDFPTTEHSDDVENEGEEVNGEDEVYPEQVYVDNNNVEMTIIETVEEIPYAEQLVGDYTVEGDMPQPVEYEEQIILEDDPPDGEDTEEVIIEITNDDYTTSDFGEDVAEVEIDEAPPDGGEVVMEEGVEVLQNGEDWVDEDPDLQHGIILQPGDALPDNARVVGITEDGKQIIVLDLPDDEDDEHEDIALDEHEGIILSSEHDAHIVDVAEDQSTDIEQAKQHPQMDSNFSQISKSPQKLQSKPQTSSQSSHLSNDIEPTAETSHQTHRKRTISQVSSASNSDAVETRSPRQRRTSQTSTVSSVDQHDGTTETPPRRSRRSRVSHSSNASNAEIPQKDGNGIKSDVADSDNDKPVATSELHDKLPDVKEETSDDGTEGRPKRQRRSQRYTGTTKNDKEKEKKPERKSLISGRKNAATPKRPASPVTAPTKKSRLLNKSPKSSPHKIPPSADMPLHPNYIEQVLSPKKDVIPSPMKIGWLGLGIMGQAMVRNLLKSGHEVTVWNRTASKCNEFVKEGALKGKCASDVVRSCDITFSCVSDPAALRDLVFGPNGVLQGISPGKGYVDMSTVDIACVLDISEAVTARGGRFLEAPVSGSKVPAQNGQLVILASGDRPLYEDCYSCFQAMGKKAFFLGEMGNGVKMKLVVNMLMGTWITGLAEAMALAEKVGLDQSELIEVLDLSDVSSPVLRTKGHAIMTSKFDPNFPLQHQQKDLRLAISMADTVDQPLHVASAANELFKKAKAKGYGEHDVAAVYRAADM